MDMIATNMKDNKQKYIDNIGIKNIDKITFNDIQKIQNDKSISPQMTSKLTKILEDIGNIEIDLKKTKSTDFSKYNNDTPIKDFLSAANE